MIFDDFGRFIDYINDELKEFIYKFASERKRLAKMGRSPKKILFAYNISQGRNWAINEGGGIEIQYHIAINYDDNTIYYGLGFNTQYVQYANEMSMVEYSSPFMKSFLMNFKKIKEIIPDYDYIIGDKSQLMYPENNQYTLYGKKVVIDYKNNKIEISDNNLQTILFDLQKQFGAYKIIFENINDEKIMNYKLIDKQEILEYKKQIILQGPPGTGKTRLAKLLAEKILIDDIIDEKFFRDRIKAPFEFKPVGFGKDYGLLSISSFNGNVIHFKGTSSIPSFSFTVEELYNCYKSRIWEEESFVDYPEYAKKALVKYLLNIAKEEIFNEQFKILQFHPSYTYEDFVRGIISESDGKNINYKTVNKILAKFADKAHKNFVESNREIPSISKRKWLEEKLSEFAESVQNAIDTTGEYRLTDKVKIVDVDDNAFYYTGDKWFEGIKHRMKFSDILEAYLQAPINKKEFKNIETISGSAKQHYGYYYKVFEDFTNSITEEFQVTSSKTKEAKDYILIIDEINRANLTSVLGELIYALEYRGEEVDSMYEVNGNNKIVLPPNLYIIGTMNTADRSVGHIDYAIRRRFAFVDVLPEILNEDFETTLFEEVSKFFVENINDKPLKRSEYLSSEFNPKDVWLGHSYFIKKDNVESSIRLEYEIIPILEEYLKDGILIDSEELRNRINNLHTFLS